MLYADDMLLFLGDTSPSLSRVMSIISDFGRYSGLTINWIIVMLLLMLMLLDDAPGQSELHPCCILLVTSFEYLGTLISPTLTDYCCLNVQSLMTHF